VVLRGAAPLETAGANVRVDLLEGPARDEIGFPGGEGPLLFAGPADPAVTGGLLDSPARREILRRLLQGDSAVWVLVEGEDKDEPAAELLDVSLGELEESLSLPELRETPEDTLTNQSVPFRLGFSVLRLKRKDPNESALVKMLLGSRSGLGDRPGPFVVPVFGRGRAMAGFPVTEEAIRQAAETLVSPCTREAKASVPGVDLLMTADWTGLVGELPGKVTEIPPEAALRQPRPEEEVVGPFEAEGSTPRSQLGWLVLTAGAILFFLLLMIRTGRSS
jgi:hypothetical protein